jgi:hypothetical protein
MQMVRPEDVPEIWELANQQNERDGTDILVPRIFGDDGRQLSSIPLALKQVVRGRLVQAHIFECQPELITVGISARGTALSMRSLPAAMWLLEQMGYQGFHALAPVARLAEWERTLGKRLNLVRDDSRVAHYYREFSSRTEQ